MADLIGVKAKLHRANFHLDAYNDLWESFLEREPYSVIFEFDSQTGWHYFRWREAETPPRVELGLIVGDLLNNLRASLDHLVWQLVLANGGTPTKQTAFPRVMKESDWSSARNQRLAGVADEWASAIKELQPFRRPERPELHWLAILDHVNNINKHRTLPIVIVTAPVWSVDVNLEEVGAGEEMEYTYSADPIEDGVELFRLRCASQRRLNVLMDERPPLHVSFRDGLNHEWLMWELVEWVENTVGIFEPAFVR